MERGLIAGYDLDDFLHCSAIFQREGDEVRSVGSYKGGADCIGREVFDLMIVTQGPAAYCRYGRAREQIS